MTDFTEPHIALHIHEQRCLNCGELRSYSHVYRVETIGKMKKLLPVRNPSEIRFSAQPIVKTSMPPEEVPMCHSCVDRFDTTASLEAHRAWAEAVKRKTGPTLSVVNGTGEAKPTKTIDDLE